jgi:hypothetical protein
MTPSIAIENVLLSCGECHFAECPHNMTLSTSMVTVVYDDCYNYSECHFDECHFDECHFDECHFDECHFDECHFAERRNAERLYSECHCAIMTVVTCK